MRHEETGSGPPVLFLHGIPTTGRLWDLVIPRMADRFTCVVVDLPGMGGSGPLPGGSLDPDRYAEELEALRAELAYPRWHVVGHDAGSTVAAHYAARFGDRVERLVLCAPPLFPEFRIPWFFRILRIPVVGDCLAPFVSMVLLPLGLRMQLQGDPTSMASARAFARAYGGFDGARRLAHIVRWGDPREVLGRTARLLPQISAPTLVLHGRRDRAIPCQFAARAGSLIPHAQALILDAGHFFPLSYPEAFCQIVAAFLIQVAAADQTAIV
jgi:pimeloyl-ACP methyl ester carboxylesterase